MSKYAEASVNKNLYLFEPPVVSTLPIDGSDLKFPVNRVFCIGRNYAAHAAEMGYDSKKEPPFFFLKSSSNVIVEEDFPYPTKTNDLHHEVEMIVALKKGGKNIDVNSALEYVFGYGIGLDMTRRDLQSEAKTMGRPWEVGKSFEKSAPCGPLKAVTEIGHPSEGTVSLEVNGSLRQHGNLDQLIWKVPEMISILSEYFELKPGDIIMTGTPSGVGPVNVGDTMVARIAGLGEITVRIV